MGRRALIAFVLLAVAQPQVASPASAPGRARTSTHSVERAGRKPARRSSPKAPSLAEAKATMAALLRDKHRRRLHHNWEKAIAGLLRAARGRDRPAALYEAAKARYALYRWSADESDREQALRLAGQAQKLGASEAKTLAQAIRREAGDDRPAPPRRHPGQRAPPPEEEEPTDPALERVLTALSESSDAAPSVDAGSGPARVSEVKAWSSPDYTRVVVYLSHWVGWQKLEFAPDRDHPRRLAVDLEPALLEGRTLERQVGGLRLSRVRAAQNDHDTVRVVLDLAGEDGVQVFRLDDPPRLVLDIASPKAPGPATTIAGGSDELAPAIPPDGASAPGAAPAETTGQATAAAPAQPADPADQADEPEVPLELPPKALAMLEAPPAPDPAPPAGGDEASPEAIVRPRHSEPDGLGAIRRIVVDAGHGGHDPGAIGPTRVREKNVTLAIARKLARNLRDAGFEVVLTRNDDRFLALEERTALANAARGDLFVSVHANAHPRRNRTGIETYFLNVNHDRYAARLAARENGVNLEVGGDLGRILTDLDAKASADESRQLARLVQREVCGGVRTRIGDVQDLGVKSALFYVLLGARMPAVLVETGFISNRDEERRLASARYQDEVAAGIARAVRSFAASEARVARRE